MATKTNKKILNEKIVIFTTGLSKLHHFEFPNLWLHAALWRRKVKKQDPGFLLLQMTHLIMR